MSQTAQKPRRPRDEARAVFRAAIFDSAEQVFASKGFHGARVQDIARHARIAVGTIYNHFGQKEDVLIALLDLRVREMVEAFAGRVSDPSDFEAKLAARFERFLVYRSQHAAFINLATEHGFFGDATSAARTLLNGRPLPHSVKFADGIGDLIDDGIASGVLANVDRDLLAAFLKATLRVWRNYPQGEKLPPAEAARRLVTLFMHGAGKISYAEEIESRRLPTSNKAPKRRSRAK